MLVALLCAGFTSAWGEDVIVSFISSTDVGTGGSAQGQNSIEKGGITISCDAGGFAINGGAHYRLGSGSTTTISSTVGNIKSIVFNGPTGTGNYSISQFDSNEGWTLDKNKGTYTWNGDAESVTVKAKLGQVRPTSIVVTYTPKAIPTYTVILGDDNSTLTETIGGAGVTLPTRSALNGYEFAGWSETNVNEETTTAPTIMPAGPYAPTANITLYPVYTKTVGGGGTTHETASVTISDYATANNWVSGSSSGPQYTEVVLNRDVKATTTGTGNNGKYYSDWRFYQNGNGNIIISTTSGILTSVTFTYTVSNTGNLNYNSSAIKSGTAVEVSGTSAEFTVGNSGTATNGQVKITAISVNYDITGAGTTYYWSAPVAAAVEIPSIVVAENPFLFSTTATITCATEGATIKYSFDGENWSNYSSVLTISETKTIYARAIKGENESDVTQVTATKNLATPSVTINGELTLDLDGETNVNAGTLTAAVTYNDAAIDGATVTWSSNKPEVATIDETTGVVTIKTPGSVTFTATYAGNSDYAEVTATKTVTVIDNNAPGSAGNPYTVAQAIAYINTLGSNTSANEVYVSGIISQVDSYSSQYNSITYWISDDGSTANQMEVYSGKGLNGADFSAVADLEVGDIVTVKGKVKKYTSNDNSIPEFTSNNQLVSFTRPEKPEHTAIFSVNGQILTVTVTEGAAITFPEDPDDINGKTFVGWITNTIDGTTNTAPAFVTSATMGTADVTYYAVYANVTPGTATYVTDVLTAADLAATNTTYTNFSGVNKNSVAVYAGQSAKTSNGGIQLRSKNSDSGIVSTTSGGIVKSVSIVVESGSNIVEVYGSNTAYENVSELYATGDNSNQGTKVGSLSETGTVSFSDDYAYVGLRSNNGAIYLTSVSITWENGTPDTYSGYCTTVVAPVVPAAPIVFHDGDATYEGTLTVPMFAEEGATIKYTVNGGDEQTYSTPVELSTGETTITAWAELNGVASDVVTKKYTIVEKAKGAVVEDGYYTIQTNEGKYVNVAGRKTVTLVNDTKSAGTVIRVKADEDGVKVLRSQAVDLPRYAERAMSYVPEIVKEVVKKLAANVDDPIIGEQGAELILDKFNQEFDYHLYLEKTGDAYRIYGRTPSMKPVVDFYAENKELVDSRLPKVEDFVKEVLQKIVDKVGRGQSVVDMFKVKTIWKNMGGTLTDPDVDQAKFFEEVLTSEKNTWEFAYQTGMLYWDKVKSYLNDNISELGDYGKYIEKIPQIRPNFKYYIVPSASGVDIISEGNSEIKNASTAWTLTKRTGFDVTFDATLSKNNGKEMYKTLYVDFAYELPKNVVKALKVESVSDAGVAVTKEITGVVPAQTAVLLMSTDVENLTKTLALSTADGAAVTNELKGNDWLINEFEINTPELETIFALLTKLSSSLGEKYEYLKRKNSGTVNNKYFFGLSVPNEEGNFKEAFMNGKIKVLTNGEKGLGFYSNFDKNLVGNEVFMFSEDTNPILLTLKGDVYRDGVIDNKDLTALVEIVLGKVTLENKPENYDFDAAHVNDDEDINIADVTALVNILNE